jgi:hypothetical protein
MRGICIGRALDRAKAVRPTKWRSREAIVGLFNSNSAEPAKGTSRNVSKIWPVRLPCASQSARGLLTVADRVSATAAGALPRNRYRSLPQTRLVVPGRARQLTAGECGLRSYVKGEGVQGGRRPETLDRGGLSQGPPGLTMEQRASHPRRSAFRLDKS